jgi:DNA helicase II / ATP-dependent DNA helicase PcrA
MPSPKRMTSSSSLESDARQQEAIEHVFGPMLVVAGAGTGKTTVLTRRIARLIQQGQARPEEILAVTYTDNAAREMRERVRNELGGGDISGLQVTTFHAYCNNLLIRCGKNFGVLDDKDLWIYTRKRIRELHLNYFVRAANVSQFLDDLLDFIRRCHDELVGPEKYAEYVCRLERGELPIPRVSKSKDAESLRDEEVIERCREISNVFATIESMLRDENLGTFSHMITRAHALLTSDAELLARECQRARFILIDEFQDANFAQVRILQKLTGSERNVFAVGDPDQAIYRFRGASSGAFALFQRHFPGTKCVALERNRRSTAPILKCAFALVDKNPEVQDSGSGSGYRRTPLLSARDEASVRAGTEQQTFPVRAVLLTDKQVESSDLVSTLREQQRKSHCRWSDFAVLYRQHLHRDQVATELAVQGIPLSIENMDVLDTREVRDLLACLGAVVSINDSASLFRVAALPQFAIDPEKLRARLKAIPKNDENANLAEVLRQTEGGDKVLESLQQTAGEITRTAAKGRGAVEIVICRFALNPKSQAITAVLKFVDFWENKPVTKTGDLAELLEYLDYFREARGVIPLPTVDQNAVRLMTVHAAKGLEFKQVFILRANSGSFPSAYREPLVEFPRELRDPDSVGQCDDKTLHQQEERRLFYVGMTRARDFLAVYARKGKGQDTTPPGFLRDLLKDKTLNQCLLRRNARGLQVDLFGQAHAPAIASRTAEWVSMPPATALNTRLSASAIQSYETCPLQFKLEREWRLPGEIPAAMQYGAALHRVLRVYYDSLRFNRPLSDEALLQQLHEDLSQAGISDPYQHDLYQQKGAGQLRDFLAAARRMTAAKVLHTEEVFEIRLKATTIAGRIDRIDQLKDGSVVIIDYKTGKPRTQDDADESLQLSIYVLAAREKWNYRVDHLSFYNLKDNAPVITRRTEQELQQTAEKVEEIAGNILAGKFEATPGRHCSFCAYRNLCPATEKIIHEIKPWNKRVN